MSGEKLHDLAAKYVSGAAAEKQSRDAGPRSSVEALPLEICVELFAQLPQVADKLRLAAASRAFWKASLDSRAWAICHTSSLPNPGKSTGTVRLSGRTP